MKWLAWPGGALLLAVGCSADDASPSGEGEGEAGELAEGDDYVAGTFVFVDGSTEDFRSPVSIDIIEIEGAPRLFVCSSIAGGDRASMLALNWTEDAEPAEGEELEQDLETIFATAGFRLSGGGVRAGGGTGGTIMFDSFGVEPGDVVSGTATELREPDPDDPEDILASVESIEFQCTLR